MSGKGLTEEDIRPQELMNQADSTRDFPFLGTFFEQADENAIFSFQQMIQALKLSSHMVVIASQPN